ncbi:hypothetical protein PMIN04_012968 [Paraphaeosphaeria minitans]
MLTNVQTRLMLSPDCLVDAEGDIDSDIEEASWPETDPAEMQDTELPGNTEAMDGIQADGRAGQATESCLPQHLVTPVATQKGEYSDQAIEKALEPELSEASSTATTTASASDEESEPRITGPTSSSHGIVNRPEGVGYAQEGDIQRAARELGMDGACSAIEEQHTPDNESTADHQDHQVDDHAAVTSLTERGASTTITSPIVHTAPHVQHANNRSVAHESIDLSSSSSEDEGVFEPIIRDTNGGKAIVINSSDEEMQTDEHKSPRTPQRRVQRKRVSPRSQEMVDWTSREHKTTSAASLHAAWKKMWKQWGKIHAESDRQLAQILDPFYEEVSSIQRYELWNERYRKHDGRRAHRAWVKYGIEKRIREQAQTKEVKGLMRRMGRALRRLREVEEEHLSIAVPMNDGDSKDCDYLPASTRRC